MTKPDLKLERVLVPPVGKEVKPLAECVSRLQEEVDRWTRNVELADPVDLTSILDRLDTAESDIATAESDIATLEAKALVCPFCSATEVKLLSNKTLNSGPNTIPHGMSGTPTHVIILDVINSGGVTTVSFSQAHGATNIYPDNSRTATTASFLCWR